MHYVYLVTRDDEQTYIGVSKDVKKRMQSHFNGRGNKYLKGSTFKYSILCEGSEAEMYAKERELINVLKPTLNIAAGGYGGNTGGRKGTDNHSAKINEADVLNIRNYSYDNPRASQSFMAEKFGISRETISNICTGRSWSHVGGPIQNRVKNKYSDEEFLKAYNLNPSPAHLTTKLNISRSTVYNLIKRLVVHKKETR